MLETASRTRTAIQTSVLTTAVVHSLGRGTFSFSDYTTSVTKLINHTPTPNSNPTAALISVVTFNVKVVAARGAHVPGEATSGGNVRISAHTSLLVYIAVDASSSS